MKVFDLILTGLTCLSMATSTVAVTKYNVIQGEQGIQGIQGDCGQNGIDGKDGVNGTDGKDGVNGKDGADGISISNSYLNNNGELIIEYSTGKIDNLGMIRGQDGKDGKNGSDGKDGKDGVVTYTKNLNYLNELTNLTFYNDLDLENLKVGQKINNLVIGNNTYYNNYYNYYTSAHPINKNTFNMEQDIHIRLYCTRTLEYTHYFDFELVSGTINYFSTDFEGRLHIYITPFDTNLYN